ncbi:hypothetical protein CERSUDRAFT_90038 [Gelatoporia subvermispora B]|uniref:DUF3752 domain-containing protein n=1 Tax=Ceriporiopsis subvermispora (strain B) TaxID=914234 RepID=M2RRH2_CERS8|nr:hypothetical protein CERSUDRAFT_90038 [Gelatoporia subvermispora B]
MIGPDLPAHLLQTSRTPESDDEGPSPAPALDAQVGPQIPSQLLARSTTPPSPSDAQIGPQIPVPATRSTTPLAPHVAAREEEEEEEEDDYVPALPPDLLAARQGGAAPAPGGAQPKKILGPALPPHLAHWQRQEEEEDGEDEDDVGPRPLPAGYAMQEKDGVQEFLEKEEKRRKQIEEAAKPKALQREEWMLKPPSSHDLLSSIDPTKLNRPRQFARTAQPTRDTDNSLWTETPAERQQRIADEVAGKRRRATDTNAVEEDADTRKRRRHEEEIRRGVEEHTRKQRGESLINQHSSLSASKEEEKKRKGDKNEPPAIWDHSRDMALGGRLMDDRSREKFIKDARGLSDRFGSGRSGGFL